MNRTIERNQLKRNFLDEIIMRLDFQGVLQAEMEKILLVVKPYLKEKQFNRYSENVNNQAVFEGASVKEASSQIEYSFINEVCGYTLKLSNTSIILSVKTTGYSPFENYSEVFSHVSEIYKNEIDFFTVKRFGLRKINYCYVKNLDEIEIYFDPTYYCCHEPIEDFGTMKTNRVSQLSDGKRNLNLRFAVDQGEIDKDQYYRVTLDSDIYSIDESTILDLIGTRQSMQAVNEILFKVYCNVLSDQLIEILSNEEKVIPEGLAGIESNEQN